MDHNIPLCPSHSYLSTSLVTRTETMQVKREIGGQGGLECVNVCRFLKKVELPRLEVRLTDYTYDVVQEDTGTGSSHDS